MNRILASTILSLTVLGALAVPAERQKRTALTADGREITVLVVGNEFGHSLVDLEGNRLIEEDGIVLYVSEADAPSAVRFAKARQSRVPQLGKFSDNFFPGKGKVSTLVILVDFPDKKFHLGDDAKRYFTDMLNKPGFDEYGGTGSARDYFLDQSDNAFDCTFDVVGPVTVSKESAYYGKNDAIYQQDMYAWQLIVEACRLVDPEIDFSKYDQSHTGAVDNVFVVYAGEGENTKGFEPNLIWPHNTSVQFYAYDKYLDGEKLGLVELDGVLLDNYAVTNEWVARYKQTGFNNYELTEERPAGIGTFCHEFSHVLGLPDLYITLEDELTALYDDFFTPGEWSVLDYGPYNNDGRTPPSYSAFERNALGWMKPEELTPQAGACTLNDIQATNHAYAISNPSVSTEFFLLESRVTTGWDKYLPGSGMLVWHVDYDKARWDDNHVNNFGAHQCVDLVEADGVWRKVERTSGDCFPGSAKVTSFTPRWWDNASAGLKLNDITREKDKSISFNVKDLFSSADYLSVADVIDSPMNANEVAVRGYIVGYVKSGNWTASDVVFNADNVIISSNVVVADSPAETDFKKCIPLQLAKGSKARNDLNLSANPSMLGKHIEVYGTLETYYDSPALRNVENYTLLDPQSSIADICNESPAPAYDLQGRRADGRTHGIVISQGRKYRK